MVHLDAVREQFVEPVGVAVLCTAQIVVASLLGVLKSIGAGKGIVGVNQLVHLTIYTVVSAIQHTTEVQPTLLFHFLVDTHLIL